MAEHHAIDFQTKLALLTEANTLMGYILSSSGGGAHATTIQAVRDFLVQFYGEGIPWIRIYHEFPDWQKQCGLFDKEWDRDAVLEKTIVFLTMISPHKARASIMREGLGGGTWKSTGAKIIGEGSLNEFVLTTLYHKGVGITVKEFHLKMDQKPRVAICVLHGNDYRHLIRDLREYIQEGRFPGQIQANPQVNSAPVVGGLMIGSDFDQTISLTSENEANYGQLPSFFRSEIPPPVAQVLPVDQFSGAVDQLSEHNHLMERYYQGPPLENSLMRTLSNDTTMTGYDHASRGIPVSSISSNTQYTNENLYDTTVLPEQDAPSNQVSIPNESSISLIGNSVGTLDWNAMPRPPPPDQAGGSAWQGPTSSYGYRPQSPPQHRGPAPEFLVHGAYGHHAVTSGHQASGSGSGWGSNHEAWAHASEEMSNWFGFFDTPEYPTQPPQGPIHQTPPPYPIQDTQDDGDLTVPHQHRAPHRWMWSTPVQPPPRDPR